MSQPNVSACFESLSSTVQSAETIQESIGAHYTLKLIQKENKTAFQKIYNLLDNKLLSKIQRSRERLRKNFVVCATSGAGVVSVRISESSSGV